MRFPKLSRLLAARALRGAARCVLTPLLTVLLLGPAFTQADWSFETAGRGCPRVTQDAGPVLYGILPAGGWHLDGARLTFVSNGTDWRMRSGGEYLAPSAGATQLAGADDELVGPIPLPFTFHYPGGAGATTAIDINTNGRVYLEAGTNPWEAGWEADRILDDFLAATPSVCPFGVDLNPGAGGALFFETRSVGSDEVALITWLNVPEYPAEGSNTVQCQLWSSGLVVVCIEDTNRDEGLLDVLVGVSSGGGAVDPGPSALTVPVGLSLTGSPILGETFTIHLRGVPSTATSAYLAISREGPAHPQPTLFGAPDGCSFQLGAPLLRSAVTLNPPFGSVSLGASDVAALTGLEAHMQAFVVDPAQAAQRPILMSDRGVVSIGVPPTLAFVAQGTSTYFGAPDTGGTFQLKSGALAVHPDIVGLEVTALGPEMHFDTLGNSGVGQQGFFSDGNGTLPGTRNAFGGSDGTVGLIYGMPGQSVSCDGTGTTGWIGSDPVGGSSTRFRDLTFAFQDFDAGESFGFDCDTDGVAPWAGAQTVRVKVTFADGTEVSGVLHPQSNERAVSVLIP